MDIMKYNGYSIRQLKGKNLYVVIDENSKLYYWNKNFNKCIDYINKENANGN